MLANLLRQWRMFTDLWGKVPADCKSSLIGEFIFNPNALERRWEEEQRLDQNLHSRWNPPR